MGRASFAFVGGFLIVNSYLLALLFPDEVFASELSAALGAVTLALPIVVTAIRDLIEGRVYMNELVALAILAAFASGADVPDAIALAAHPMDRHIARSSAQNLTFLERQA